MSESSRGNEVGRGGKGQITQGLSYHGKEFRLCFKSDGKPHRVLTR